MNDFPPSVAVVANSAGSLVRFRAPLIRKLIERGAHVYAISPDGESVDLIEEMGAEFVSWPLDRRGLNPLGEVSSILSLLKIYRRIRPDLVQHFTVKPNIYGAVAARIAKVPVILGGVTGLGYAFGDGGTGRRFLRLATLILYRVASAFSDRLTFQNARDLAVLLGQLPDSPGKGLLIPGGSGVDLRRFGEQAVSGPEVRSVKQAACVGDDSILVTMAARLLYDKGLNEFAHAARIVMAHRPAVQFIVAGAVDPGNRESASEDDLSRWSAEYGVRFIGHRDDMPAVLAASEIVALPSYYPEGVPRILLEATAMGRPIVATQLPGIIDTVEDGVTGVLVPPRDSEALANAILELVDDPDLRRRYGAAGRKKAEREFDDVAVADRYIAEYARLWRVKQGLG